MGGMGSGDIAIGAMGCAEGIDGMEGKGGSGGTDCMTCVGAGIRCCPYAPGMTVVAEVGQVAEAAGITEVFASNAGSAGMTRVRVKDCVACSGPNESLGSATVHCSGDNAIVAATNPGSLPASVPTPSQSARRLPG